MARVIKSSDPARRRIEYTPEDIRAMTGKYTCEFEGCDATFDHLPEGHLSALGFYCDEHEEWMEEHRAEERARDRKILLEQMEIDEAVRAA